MKRRIEIWMVMMVAAVLAGCYDYDRYEVVNGGEPVKVDMAFSLSGSVANKTRMAETVVNGASRDFIFLQVIPLKIDPTTTKPCALELSNPEFVNKAAAKFFLANCKLEAGVNDFIVYAKAKESSAPDDVTPKAHNGCLIRNNFPDDITVYTDFTDLTSITFSPWGMIDGENDEAKAAALAAAQAEAAPLATYLTNIANATVTTNNTSYSWQDSDNSILKKLFDNFINKKNGEIKVIAGSAVNVREWGQQLKDALIAQSFPEGSKERAIQDRIVALCDPTTITGNKYPRSKDLPDGAAVLKWEKPQNSDTYAFIPKVWTTTIDDITTITRYVYPPELYYFVDSSIKTSNEEVDYKSLYLSKDEWGVVGGTGGVINDDRFTKNAVEKTTKAVALVDPVQYAVAQLKVTIRTTTETVPDGKDPANNITVGTTNFPLIGVIVGGQRPVNYLFEQKYGQPSGEEAYFANVKFVYDSQVKTNNNDYYYLTYSTSSPTADTPGTNTLVLQSYDGEDVTIILEFENKSGSLFYGVNQQIIYPGTRFYLVGTIPAPTYDNVNDYKKRVFTKDYITQLNVTVSSLAKAYNVLPNILSSNLEIGIETTPQWIAATPTTVILE